MPWYRRFRMLIGIYAIALVVGVREYVIRQAEPEVDPLSDRWAEMTDVVEAINPGDPDTEYLESIQAMRRGDSEAFMQHMEAAIASGVKHNDVLMQTYAQQLLSQGADYRRINEALNAWRINHPASAETIWLPLAVPPSNQSELDALHGALAEVPWIAGGELETVETPSGSSVRVHISFRPPLQIDIREAVAAVSVLSLSEEERRRFRVRCLTLIDCNVEPR
jgi:hypothetical protein